ncbi:MAG: sigma-54 dependent transcriptional regulator [Byssovorax sp.]
MSRALVVDDNEHFAFGVAAILRSAAFDCTHAASGEEALAATRSGPWDVVLLDLGLPDRSGLDVLARFVEVNAASAVIVLTGRDDAASAVRALRLGAAHYLTKPARKDELLAAVAEARARCGVQGLAAIAADEHGVIGRSGAWQSAVRALRAAARAPRTSVLVTGESGTGKEMAAQLIHAASDRRGGPFVSMNASCLSPSLLESELFGHEAGAFTGARGPKRGLFELASGGTLFLDEVGELPLDLQPRLLRVLEGHPFRRVGGEREIKVDVRLVSATNRSLSSEVLAGRFRLDLYHRLRVIDVTLPPLRERREDIPLLAGHFLLRFGEELGKPRLALSAEALALLLAHPWPGNVRELRNAMERGAALCEGQVIRPRDLPPELGAAASLPGAAPAAEEDAPGPLDAMIRAHVLRAYRATGENLSQTARVLGISRVALRRRLKEYGVKPHTASGVRRRTAPL